MTGRSALLLSGGLSFGLYHFGVVKALFERGCLPRVISGASIGALVVALLGIHTDQELETLWKAPVNLAAFEELGKVGSARRKFVRLLKEGVLMDVEKLVKLCKDNVGNITFAEAYRKTGRIINITLPHKSQNQGGSQLLNYLTAPHVLLWSAACASCAQAGLYESVELHFKNERNEVQPTRALGKADNLQRHDDLPMHRLSELFNVNNFVVSQVSAATPKQDAKKKYAPLFVLLVAWSFLILLLSCIMYPIPLPPP